LGLRYLSSFFGEGIVLNNGTEMEDFSMQLVSREHIEIASDVRSGKPRIVGTRIAVEDMAVMHLKLR
jgi:hypothetical protein